jgi:hypothetical protein
MKNMMKKIFMMMMAITSIVLTGACSSSDDGNNGQQNGEQKGLQVVSSGRPDWHVDLTYNETAPNWQAPDPSLYENWFIMMFRVQDELMEYFSNDDMVAVFIGDELRALSHPARSMDGSQTANSDSIYYILKVYGNESADLDIQVTLKLWSAKLHQTFTIKGNGKFINEAVTGDGSSSIPNISLGSSKYPVTSLVNVNFKPAEYGLEPSDDDMLAAFIGNECRGTIPLTVSLPSSSQIPLVVFGEKEGETARVLYYNAKSNTVYDTGITLQTARQEEQFSLD